MRVRGVLGVAGGQDSLQAGRQVKMGCAERERFGVEQVDARVVGLAHIDPAGDGMGLPRGSRGIVACSMSSRSKNWRRLAMKAHSYSWRKRASPRKARSLSRFPTAQHLARYAGVVPQVQSSGEKTWRGATSKESKHHLKWALVEAANTVAAHQTKWTEKYPHAVGPYQRVKATTKLSGEAKVAVAGYLAEAI